MSVVLVGSAGAQSADRPGLALTWQRPAGCPDEAAMRAKIAEAAGGPGAADGAARARAGRLPDGEWIVELDVGDGPRTLRGDTCDDVARAAALVIGIALRAQRSAPAVTERSAQVGDAEVPWRDRPGGEPAAVEARVERRPAVRLRPAIAARAGVMTGALPELAAMARVGVVVRAGDLAGRVDATFATARHGMLLEAGAEAAVRVDLIAGTGSGCYVTGWLWWCGGLEIGTVRALASAGDAHVSGAGMWVAGHVGPSAALSLSRSVDLVLEMEAAVPLVYPRFSVNDVALTGPEAVSLRTSLGLRVDIP